MTSFSENLRKLQNADNARKRKWLTWLTTFAMLIVILAWIQYFNTLVVPPSHSGGAGGRSFTFGETFRAGLEAVRDSALAGIRKIGTIWNAPNSISIEPRN